MTKKYLGPLLAIIAGDFRVNNATLELGTNGTTPIANIAGSIKLWSAGDNDFYTTFTAAEQTDSETYTLPTAMPTVSGCVLSATDAGVMSWCDLFGTANTWTATQSFDMELQLPIENEFTPDELSPYAEGLIGFYSDPAQETSAPYISKFHQVYRVHMGHGDPPTGYYPELHYTALLCADGGTRMTGPFAPASYNTPDSEGDNYFPDLGTNEGGTLIDGLQNWSAPLDIWNHYLYYSSMGQWKRIAYVDDISNMAITGHTDSTLSQSGQTLQLNLDNDNTWTALQIIAPTGISNSIVNSFQLKNPTASTSGDTIHYSPALSWQAQGWKTGPGSGNKTYEWVAYVIPGSGIGTSSSLNFAVSYNGGAFTTPYSLGSNGNPTFSGLILSGGSIFLYNGSNTINLKTATLNANFDIILPNLGGTLALANNSSNSWVAQSFPSISITPNIDGSNTGINSGNYNYATATTPLVTDNLIDMGTYAWNGTDGYSIASKIVIGMTQLSTTTQDARVYIKNAWNGLSNELLSIDTLTGNVGIGTSSPTSKLHVSGAIATAISSKTSAYSLTVSDSTILGDATSAPFTATLPDATTCFGRVYRLKKIDSSGNAVTVACYSAQTIDGAATLSLSTQWQSVTVQSDGANWMKL